MNKYILFFFIPIMLSADDVIIDQSSLSQYQIDNCVRFDEFDFDDNQFVWNPVTGNYTPDRIYLTDDPIILGGTGGDGFRRNYTQEVWIYKEHGGVATQKIIGSGFGPNSPPSIHYSYIPGNEWRFHYGYGNGNSWIGSSYAPGSILNEWTHIAVTKDTLNFTVYLNGEEVEHFEWDNPSHPAFVLVESPQVELGHNYIGKMDNVR